MDPNQKKNDTSLLRGDISNTWCWETATFFHAPQNIEITTICRLGHHCEDVRDYSRDAAIKTYNTPCLQQEQ